MTTVSIALPVDSKHWKNFSYIKLPSTDNATKSRMTFYILHPYRRASTRNNMSKFTIVFCVQCYVSVITEKYDLSFQLTYQTVTFDFQTNAKRHHALLDMSRIKQTVVLDLRTSNILISVLPTIGQLISKTFISKRIQRDTQVRTSTQRIPFIRRKIEMGKCSSPVTAVHASGASKWPISPFIPASAIFVGKTGKKMR